MSQPAHKKRPSAVQTKSQQDFISIYRQYVERVYRYVIARVGDRAEAEDLTSQVFLEAFRTRERLREVENLPAWLFTIARNKVVDAYRGHKGERPLQSIEQMPAQLEDPLVQVITIEREQDLKAVLAALRPEQLELLQLRYAGELSYRQIGEVVGKSEAAVKMAIHRLLDQLQREMEHEHE